MGEVRIKRAYDAPADTDGYRVLVDRLWPRGVSKDDAELDEWFKDVAPSSELRTWFGHDPERFEEFAARYRAELDGAEALADVRHTCDEQDRVTLVYGAKDPVHNHAAVLYEVLGGRD